MLVLLLFLVGSFVITWRSPTWTTFAALCSGLLGYGMLVEPLYSDGPVRYGIISAMLYIPAGLVVMLMRRA